MTENEAKEWIKYLGNQNLPYDRSPKSRKLACDIAIQALEENQQYRAMGTVTGLQDMKSDYFDTMCDCRQYSRIGTIEEFKALKEKNEPKKIEFMHNRSDTVSVWKCHCGNVFLTKHKEGILDGTDVNYCCKCGQKIDWSDDNE